jgi:hypothetical protein
MKIWEKFGFAAREVKIWELYQVFRRESRRHGIYRKFLPESKDPRKSKYWKYFDEAYSNFESDSTFDPNIFVEAQFRNVPKDKEVWPAQLKTRAAAKRYKDHRSSIKMVDTVSQSEQIINNLANTFKFMKKWWKRNQLNMDDYEKFFEKEESELISNGMNYCLQGLISKYFMSVSKHFLEEYKKLDPDMKWEVIRPDELRAYRVKLKLDDDAYDFAKDLFKGEII